LAWSKIAAALEGRGHRVTIADLRFSGSVEQQLRRTRPGLVGIAGMHALETDEVLGLAREIRRLAPDADRPASPHRCRVSGALLSGPVDAVSSTMANEHYREIVDAIEGGVRSVRFQVSPLATRRRRQATARRIRTLFDLDDVPLLPAACRWLASHNAPALPIVRRG
jgi:hypothetical protein